jgi:hypothetical protein
MICDYCSRDLNNINQDNLSCKSGIVVCEDCIETAKKDDFYINYEDEY